MTALVTDVTEANAWAAIEAFIAAFAEPSLATDGLHIIPGFANDQSLPPDGNDFAIFTPIRSTRKGTNRQIWDELEDKITLAEYVETVWQIDFYSSSPIYSMRRAQAIEQMARSETAVRFMRERHCDLLYADAPDNLSGLLDSGRYVSRWSVELRVGVHRKLQSAQQYSETGAVDVINVDVRFPPA